MLVQVAAVRGEASLKSGGDGKTGTGHGIADDQRSATTELVDKEDAGGLTDEGNDRIDALKQEDFGVAVTKGRKDFGSVVLNGGDTGYLNRELEDDTNSDFSHVLSAVENLAPATVSALFEGELSLDLSKLGSDKNVRGVTTCVKTSQGAEGVLFAALAHEPSRGFGEEHDEESEGDGRRDLETKRESPFKDSSLMVKVAAVNDKTGDQSTDTEEELLESRESASNGRVGDLGLVERSQKRKHSDSDPGKESTGHHHALVGSSGLEDTTDDENDGTDHDGESSRKGIGNEGRRDTTDESTEEHGTDDEANVIGARIVGDAQKVFRDNDSGNDTEIWSE